MKAIIVGGGPVGCLMAYELRRHGVEVTIYERIPDPRNAGAARGLSFNLTLTLRGLRTLDEPLWRLAHEHGLPLADRVVHHPDGSISRQPYGTRPDHYLLSIPRAVLHRVLVEQAETAGVRLRFGHTCVRIDPRRAGALFLHGDTVVRDSGDVLIGCDGANSVVRQEMVRGGARMHVEQEFLEQGYLEVPLPPAQNGGPALLAPDGGRPGLHVWPRGDGLLIAQPNRDDSHTATLFMRAHSDGAAQPALDRLTTPVAVRDLLVRDFASVAPFLPDEFPSPSPATLRTVRCAPFHHGRTVLVGDAAHTIVPFFGQGINCGFEDVATLGGLIAGLADRPDSVASALAAFTAARVTPVAAITQLSLDNLTELAAEVDRPDHRARSRLERALRQRHPERFVPLYERIAFSSTPYDEALAIHQRDNTLLDALCRRYDPDTQQQQILHAFVTTSREAPAPTGLEAVPEQAEELLTAVTTRLLDFHRGLQAGRYPASYVFDSLDAAGYLDGRQVSTELREDQPPELGAGVAAPLDELFGPATTNGTMHPHPGFLAHVPSGGLLAGAVGQLVAHATNRFGGVWLAAPGLQQIESNVIRWFCQMLGYDNTAFGYLTTGGSMANFMAIVTALRAATGTTAVQATVYASTQAHFSVAKAAGLAGIPNDHIRAVPTRPDLTIDVANLERTIAADRAAGLTPACVVATAGTTNTGAIDDLPRVIELCRRQGIWSHVDACFGGFFRITARGRQALDSIERADSIAVDGHKSLFLPHGNAALLVRDRIRLRDAFQVPSAGYLPGFIEEPDLVDFCNYGPELTREVRGPAAWLPLKAYGLGMFRRRLDNTLDLAEYLANRIADLPGIRVVQRHPRHLPVVTFAMPGADTAHLCELICSRGNAYLTTTELPDDGIVIRACILHHRTDRAVIDALVADAAWAVNALQPDQRCPAIS